jgi:hypothetical protein
LKKKNSRNLIIESVHSGVPTHTNAIIARVQPQHCTTIEQGERAGKEINQAERLDWLLGKRRQRQGALNN